MHNRTRLVALVVLLIVGCAEIPTEPDRKSLPMMPLAVGNRWIGRSYALDTAGSQIDLVYDTLEIVSTIDRDGETWFVARDGTHYINRTGGLWILDAFGATHHLAKHPASVGETFDVDTVRVLRTDTTSHDVDSVVVSSLVDGVGVGLSGPTGSYLVNAYRDQIATLDGHVMSSDEPLWMGDIRYFAPAVGLVREEHFVRTSSGPSVQRIWELIEVRLR